jgi:hypothetical protein
MMESCKSGALAFPGSAADEGCVECVIQGTEKASVRPDPVITEGPWASSLPSWACSLCPQGLCDGHTQACLE